MTATEIDQAVVDEFVKEALKGQWCFVPGVGWHEWRALSVETQRWYLTHKVGESLALVDGSYQPRVAGDSWASRPPAKVEQPSGLQKVLRNWLVARIAKKAEGIASYTYRPEQVQVVQSTLDVFGHFDAFLDLAAQSPWVMIPGPMLDKYVPEGEPEVPAF